MQPKRRTVFVIEERANAAPEVVAAVARCARLVHRDSFPGHDDIAKLLRDEPRALALYVTWNTSRDETLECVRRFRSAGFLGSVAVVGSGESALDNKLLSEIYSLAGSPLVSAPDLGDVIEEVLDVDWHGWTQIPNSSAIAVLKARYSLSSRELIEVLFPMNGESEGLIARLARARDRRRALAAIEERVGRSADDLRLEFELLRGQATALVG